MKKLFTNMSKILYKKYIFLAIYGHTLVEITYYYIYDYKLSCLINTASTIFKNKTNIGIDDLNIEKYIKFIRRFCIIWGIIEILGVEVFTFSALFGNER